jgi:hypothetical protein
MTHKEAPRKLSLLCVKDLLSHDDLSALGKEYMTIVCQNMHIVRFGIPNSGYYVKLIQANDSEGLKSKVLADADFLRVVARRLGRRDLLARRIEQYPFDDEFDDLIHGYQNGSLARRPYLRFKRLVEETWKDNVICTPMTDFLQTKSLHKKHVGDC